MPVRDLPYNQLGLWVRVSPAFQGHGPYLTLDAGTYIVLNLDVGLVGEDLAALAMARAVAGLVLSNPKFTEQFGHVHAITALTPVNWDALVSELRAALQRVR